MRVRLIFIETDFRGNNLSQREEIIEGESSKSVTRNHVASLIARHHPELKHAGGVWLLDSSETPHRWYVHTQKVAQNRWLNVYADPVAEQEQN